jgi:hypothetical protein
VTADVGNACVDGLLVNRDPIVDPVAIAPGTDFSAFAVSSYLVSVRLVFPADDQSKAVAD